MTSDQYFVTGFNVNPKDASLHYTMSQKKDENGQDVTTRVFMKTNWESHVLWYRLVDQYQYEEWDGPRYGGSVGRADPIFLDGGEQIMNFRIDNNTWRGEYSFLFMENLDGSLSSKFKSF